MCTKSCIALRTRRAGADTAFIIIAMLNRITDSTFNAIIKGKHGYIVYNKYDRFIGKAIEKYGEYSEGEVDLFRQLCGNGDVIVEVGANIGAHTLVLSHIVGDQGRVYAFEPQRIVFQTLCANMAINSITNVECFHAAVASSSGNIHLPDIRYDIEGNYGGFDVGRFKEGIKVPQVALNGFLEISRLKLLKVDVEGMEYEVIAGAKDIINRFRPALYIENDRVEKSKALIELVWSLDYRLYWHTPMLFNPKNFAADSENIYPNLASFNMLGFHNSVKIDIKGPQEITDSGFHPLKKS